MVNPSDLETIEFLTERLKARVKPFLANEDDLNQGFSVYGYEVGQDFKKTIEENIRASLMNMADSAPSTVRGADRHSQTAITTVRTISAATASIHRPRTTSTIATTAPTIPPGTRQSRNALRRLAVAAASSATSALRSTRTTGAGVGAGPSERHGELHRPLWPWRLPPWRLPPCRLPPWPEGRRLPDERF